MAHIFEVFKLMMKLFFVIVILLFLISLFHDIFLLP